MQWDGGGQAQRGPRSVARSLAPEGDQTVTPPSSVSFGLRDFAWFIGGGIVVSSFITPFLVVLFVDFQSRFQLWRIERTHQEALQEIRDIGDKWAATLKKLDAKSDTVNRWRRYFPKSMGGSKP